MISLLLSELLVLVHFAFVLFVVFGGMFTLKWRWMVWVHLPAVLWGVIVEVTGWVCPLTILENNFRLQAGQQGYGGDFLAHYLMPVLYPPGLDLNLQLLMAGTAILINIVIYSYVFKKTR